MTERSPIIPWIVAFALLMQNLDSTAVTTAVPQMARSFSVEPVRLSAVVTSYVLAVAVFLPASGWVADRFGARRVFATAIACFTLASMACGLAPGITSLVVARIAQGCSGAMMVPVARLILVRSVPREGLIQAMARMTTPALIGPLLGPLAGGLLTSTLSWRWIFFINLPIGVVGIILVLILIPDGTDVDTDIGGFDWIGFFLSGLTLGCLVAGLEAVSRAGESYRTDLSLVTLGCVLAVGYAAHARRRARPMLDLSLFRHPTFAAGVGGGTLYRLGAGSLSFLLPMLFQVGFGLSAIQSGSLTFMTAVGALISKSFARRLLRHLGFRRVLIGDALASAIVLSSYTMFAPSTPHIVIMGLLLLGGVLRSIQFTSMNSLTFVEIADGQTGQANTIANVAQQFAVSAGVAVAAIMLRMSDLLAGRPELDAQSFAPAFCLIGIMTALSAFWFGRLPRDIGDEITRRQRFT